MFLPDIITQSFCGDPCRYFFITAWGDIYLARTKAGQPFTPEDVETMRSLADQALYKAKRAGKDAFDSAVR